MKKGHKTVIILGAFVLTIGLVVMLITGMLRDSIVISSGLRTLRNLQLFARILIAFGASASLTAVLGLVWKKHKAKPKPVPKPKKPSLNEKQNLRNFLHDKLEYYDGPTYVAIKRLVEQLDEIDEIQQRLSNLKEYFGEETSQTPIGARLQVIASSFEDAIQRIEDEGIVANVRACVVSYIATDDREEFAKKAVKAAENNQQLLERVNKSMSKIASFITSDEEGSIEALEDLQLQIDAMEEAQTAP